MNLRFVDRQTSRGRVDEPARRGGSAAARGDGRRDRPQLRRARGLGRPPGADADPPTCRRLAAGTAGATPELRAEGVRAVIAAADAAGVLAFGSFSTSAEHLAIVNSHGIQAVGERTVGPAPDRDDGPDGGSGYAEQAGVDVARSTRRRSGARPPTRPGRPANPVAVEPGDWPVVLEEYAVVDILYDARLHGVQRPGRPRGALVRRAGQAVGSELVTIVDDGSGAGRDADGLRLRGRREAARRR